jgi:NitT/TauT family transport system substrate-binding protein
MADNRDRPTAAKQAIELVFTPATRRWIARTAQDYTLAICLALAILSTWIYLEYPFWFPPEKAPIRIAVAKSIGYGPLYIAKEKGFFRGIEVELYQTTEDYYNTAIFRREVDGYCNSLDSVVRAAAWGLPGSAVYLFREAVGATALMVKPEINDVAALKGKRVAAETSRRGHFFLLHILESAGIGPDQYTHINLDADRAGAALLSEKGALAGAVTDGPWLARIGEAHNGKVLVSTRDYPGLVVDALIIAPSYIRRRPEAVRSIVAGLFEAVEFWKEHPSEATEIIARNFNLKPDEIDQLMTGNRYLDRNENQAYLKSNGRAAKTIELANRVWRTNRPDVSEFVTDAFVR